MPDQAWMRERLRELERIHRPSASEGEREAAEWLLAEFAPLGVRARIETEPAHGTYWWPLGIGAAAGLLGGIASLRGHRALGFALGALGAAGIAEIGPADAERAVVFVAHHDTAHSGLVFHPAIPRTIAEHFPQVFERVDTSPPLMAPVIGGPSLATLGGLTGSRLLSKLGVLLGAGSVAAMIDIGLRDAVPGANDNGTAVVALLALAQNLVSEPAEDVRVVLLSTGSEESFSEGMKAFGERHFAELPRESTFFVSLEMLGADHLLALRGEGFLRMREYPPPPWS